MVTSHTVITIAYTQTLVVTLVYVDQDRKVELRNKNYVTQGLLAWLGIKDHFLHSPYILRIEMGEGGSWLNSLTMISYYSELV